MRGRGNWCELRARFRLPHGSAGALARSLSPDCERLPRGLRAKVDAKGASVEISLRAKDASSLLNAAEDIFRCAEAASVALAELGRREARQTLFKPLEGDLRPPV
jgi:tRNA threonylcarbamoyladenosine modification (KEOPS) complex  Pcc1 subunit